MTKELEFICTECKEKISLSVSEREYAHYQKTGSFSENSEEYMEFFEGYGWVLQHEVFCDICKYDHSECYAD